MRIIREVKSAGEELDSIRVLFREYEESLGENLCFQGFEEELINPLLKYGPPHGVIFLALWNFEAVGCVALYPLQESGVCEMKRLYVKPNHRGAGTARTLVALLIDKARELGYHTMKLDTLSRLQPAIQLYKNFGFRETSPYYENPIPDVVYMELNLLH